MKGLEFKDYISNLIDSMKLNRAERLYICKKYYNSYVMQEELRNDVTTVQCINILAELIQTEPMELATVMTLEDFKILFETLDNSYPYNCSYMCSIVSDLEVQKGIQTSDVTKFLNDNSFKQTIKLNSDELHTMYDTVLKLLTRCHTPDFLVHNILELWLNTCIQPLWKDKLIGSDLLQKILKVAELAEQIYKQTDIYLEQEEAFELSFNEYTCLFFKDSTQLIEIFYKESRKPLAAGKVINFVQDNNVVQGKIVGTHFVENKRFYLVEHNCLTDGYTVSAVEEHAIQGGDIT